MLLLGFYTFLDGLSCNSNVNVLNVYVWNVMIMCWKSVLKISVRVENCNACWKLLKTCWKNVLKISACIENCNTCWKLCWKHVVKAWWNFQHMLKSVMHVEKMLKISACIENCNAWWKHVEKVCWKFQHMLKTITHVENYLENFKVCWKYVENIKAAWKL